jgi:uncharacterized membrane protein YhhN
MVVTRRYLIWIFGLALLLHFIFIYLKMNELRILSKLLLIPFLIIYFLSACKRKINPLVLFGLIFSFIGDLFLTRSGELFFLLGMFAFMGTHIGNSLFFLQLQKKSKGKREGMVLAGVLLVIVSSVIFFVLQPYLGGFQWPILFYMLVISIMAVLATGTARDAVIMDIAANCIIPGAILFVLSDSILAINKFLLHEPMADIPVMLTYGAAQYFLVKGFVKIHRIKIELTAQ